MAKSRHNKIVEIVFNLSKGCKFYKKVFADHIFVGYKSINILSHHKRSIAEVYPYLPDIWCKSKQGRIDIYEVWDNQSEDACVEDILFSALTPNVYSLSIICFEEEYYKLAKKLVKIILSSLFDDEGELLLDPDNASPYIVLIPENIQNDDNKIKKFLRDKLNLK